ncbi:MAG: tRNA uridine-5-carboxymethylaminomethyl(34) synthesis GTPase MnmE [Candidatus Zixiibacteriota bacterium]|nr:MAG: tRNA uridine-5-carboxymethylaminomethyl(34) synthesis GTPase MnmE [candidate division Zixibacteria bacterium]
MAALRLAGKRSLELLKLHFKPAKPSEKFRPFLMRYGVFTGADGEQLDEVLAVYMPEKHSYTGLDQVEIFCHGGQQIVRRILGELVGSGARPAEPGEFTKLAFLHGRIDLTRAEAVAQVISASTEASLKAGREHLFGAYSEHIETIRDDLVTVIADIEAGIDFLEEDGESDNAASLARITSIEQKIARLEQSYDGGRIINEGFRVVIGGRPNAGKSSLFNLLLRQERAIVTGTAGTTRDYLSEWIELSGFPVNLIDTAGLRQLGGSIEKAGQARAEEMISEANLIIWMVDLSRKTWPSLLRHDLTELPKIPILLLLNKIDLIQQTKKDLVRKIDSTVSSSTVITSCKSGRGITRLKTKLVEAIESHMPDMTSGLVVTSARHKGKLGQALRDLRRARKNLVAGESPELVVFDLRQATSALDEITGRIYTEELLGRIFSKFCIGK